MRHSLSHVPSAALRLRCGVSRQRPESVHGATSASGAATLGVARSMPMQPAPFVPLQNDVVDG
jgi:hypothetical protein